MKTTEEYWEVQWLHVESREWGFTNRTLGGEEAARELYADARRGRSCPLRLVKIVKTVEETVTVLKP